MNHEQPNPYAELLPQEHELILQYQPVYLDKGGDHVVYELPEHPDVVVKASRFKIKDILTYNAQHGLPLDALPETMLDWSGEEMDPKEEVTIKNRQIQTLRQYFGSDHTLNEKRYLMKVPVTNELLQAIFAEDDFKRLLPEGAEHLTEVWSIVVVQKKSKEIADKTLEHESLNFGSFVEKREGEAKVDPEKLEQLNQTLLKGSQQQTFDEALFFNIQDGTEHKTLQQIVERTAHDDELKNMLQDLVAKMIDFGTESGNILALAGKDNLILFKKDDEWTYLLVDAIPVHNEEVLSVAQDLVHRIINKEDVWHAKTPQRIKYEKELIMKAYNFVRLANGLAAVLHIDTRLRFISPEDISHEVDFNAIIS